MRVARRRCSAGDGGDDLIVFVFRDSNTVSSGSRETERTVNEEGSGGKDMGVGLQNGGREIASYTKMNKLYHRKCPRRMGIKVKRSRECAKRV